jgi:NAD(P)-dependent dehydrogenase (short-subunit alcohol dehydrogenase family)
MSKVIIAGADSGISRLIINFLVQKNWNVYATTRRKNNVSDNIFFCDFSDSNSVDFATSQISEVVNDWELLVISIGLLEPIDKIIDLDMNQSAKSIDINFVNQVRFVRNLVKNLEKKNNQLVLTFAGGGTNSAVADYFAYTVSKIALIKSMELMAHEIPELKFISLGTGWIDTPIHKQTLNAVQNKNTNLFYETERRIRENDFGDPELICKFILWAINQPTRVISGRNFSLQNDPWLNAKKINKILKNKEAFKLRRSSNFEK